MPRGDGTGPWGMGAMTGRAAGFCAGYQVPGFANPVAGRGFWRAGGRGHRHMYYATGLPGWTRLGWNPWQAPYGAAANWPQASPDQELGYLKDQADYFQNALGDIQKRIEELEKDAGEK
ncbi:DUF5320 domain-containing protein [candidate division KSB1 bacterium]|nr:DUF5320 domain-containing protein [candidate division KSB1 bacterium]